MRALDHLLAPLTVPAIQPVATALPSRSHLGGDAGLEDAAAWPTWDGSRLDFLARLSLPELQRAQPVPWLPTKGALLFFYDIDEQVWGYDPSDYAGWSVLYVPDLLQPIARLESATGNYCERPLPHRGLGFRPHASLPLPWDDRLLALALSPDEQDAYNELLQDSSDGLPKHQIGGNPVPEQSEDMFLECQLVSHGVCLGERNGSKTDKAKALASGVANWRLLLQLDTDDDWRVMWGDCGKLYFFVEEERARAADFSNVWVRLQT
jgi:uncharacterized protein YwqG